MPCLVSFTSEPCCYDLTRDFMYPSCLIYLRDCHIYSCQRSSQSWSLIPMEVVRIDMEHDKDLLHPEHPMKLSYKEDWPMDATLMGVYIMLWEIEKEKLHGRPRSFSPFDCPDIVVSPQSRHPSSFLVQPPPSVNLRMRFLLGGTVVTPRVTFSPNHFQ
jgi:hypothetical protein